MTTLKELLAEYQTKVHKSTPAQISAMTDAIKEARNAEQAAMAKGAKPCKECGQMPHVIKQERGSGDLIINYYEVGCLTVHKTPRRVKRQTLDEAIAAWNETYS